MPRLPSSDEVIRALIYHGFIFVSQKGSHAKYRLKGKDVRTVIVPVPKKEIPVGTFRSILRQAGLSSEDILR